MTLIHAWGYVHVHEPVLAHVFMAVQCVYGNCIACISGVQGSVCTVLMCQFFCRGLRGYGLGYLLGFSGCVDHLGQGYDGHTCGTPGSATTNPALGAYFLEE